MTPRSHRSIRLAPLLAMLAVAVAACGSAATPRPSATVTASPTAATSPTASTGSSQGPSSSPASSPSAAGSPTEPASPSPSVGQTDTDWGRIWDAIPPGFPTYPDSRTTEVGTAASEQRVVSASVDEVATWYQSALETAGYSTLGLSGPFEDGSMVVDSVGEPLECHVQVRIGPLGELVLIDILYGADCPFS